VILPQVEVIAEAGFIIPLSLASLACGAVRRRRERVGWRELVGGLVFAAGTALNVGSELERFLWKQQPANAGRLFTLGLWQHVRSALHLSVGSCIVLQSLPLVRLNRCARSSPRCRLGT
jgi:steroid 5-alpha reductase family enzyme